MLSSPAILSVEILTKSLGTNGLSQYLVGVLQKQKLKVKFGQ